MIKILASGSSGNCYIIQAGEEKLLLECGISYKDILEGLNYSIKGVVGCLVSHEHLDHCKSFKKVCESIKTYAPLEVLQRFKCENNYKSNAVENKENFKLGGFTIMPFNCQHTNPDGSECVNMGYLIHHKKIGKIVFATDTYYLKYKFKDVDYVLVECNYSEENMKDIEQYQQRIFKAHMSLETLKKTLKTWDLSKTKSITLIHLSKNNADPKEFKKQIEATTGIPVVIARGWKK